MRVRGTAAAVTLLLIAAQAWAARPEAARKLKSVAAAASAASWIEMYRVTFGRLPVASTTAELSDALGLESTMFDGGDSKPIDYKADLAAGSYEIRSGGEVIVRNGELVTPLEKMLRDLGVMNVDDLSASLDQSRAERTIMSMRRLARDLDAHEIDHGRFPAQPPTEKDGWGTPLRVEVSADGKSYSIASAGSDRKFDPSSWRRAGEFTDFAADAVWRNGESIRSWETNDLAESLNRAKRATNDLADVRRNAKSERTKLANTLHTYRIAHFASTGRPKNALEAYELAGSRAELRDPVAAMKSATNQIDDSTDMSQLTPALVVLERLIRGEVASFAPAEADRQLAARMEAVPQVPAGWRLLHRLSQHPRAGEQTRAYFTKAVESAVRRGTLTDAGIIAAARIAPPAGAKSQTTSEPLRVGGDIKAPIVMTRALPVIPEAAQKAGVAGIVLLEAVIDEKGRVVKSRVLRSMGAEVDQAAEQALKRWTFKPATRNGQPVTVVYPIPVNIKSPAP